MTRRYSVLAVVMLASACAHFDLKWEPTSGQQLAYSVMLVWEAYGCNGSAPEVLVVEGPDLTCTDPNSRQPGKVSVTKRMPWSSTSLRHKLMHACLANRGILDPWHLRNEWKTEVPAARGMLEAQGL